MGLRGALTKKIGEWNKNREERRLQDTGYKMAYREAYREEAQKALRNRVSSNARRAAVYDIERRYPGKRAPSKKTSRRGGSRYGGTSRAERLNSAFGGAMFSMGFGPKPKQPRRPTRRRPHYYYPPRRRSRPRQPRQQTLSFI